MPGLNIANCGHARNCGQMTAGKWGWLGKKAVATASRARMTVGSRPGGPRASKLQLRKRSAETETGVRSEAASAAKRRAGPPQPPAGAVGLVNLGDTCYINVSAQARVRAYRVRARILRPKACSLALFSHVMQCFRSMLPQAVVQALFHCAPVRAALSEETGPASPACASSQPTLLSTLARCFSAMDCVSAFRNIS